MLSLWAVEKFGLGSSYLPDTAQRSQKSVEQFNIGLRNIALNRSKEAVDKRHLFLAAKSVSASVCFDREQQRKNPNLRVWLAPGLRLQWLMVPLSGEQVEGCHFLQRKEDFIRLE